MYYNTRKNILGKGYIVDKKPPRKPKVLFISQPMFRDGEEEADTYDYFCQLFASLNIRLNNSFPRLDCVTKVVPFEYAASFQNQILDYCINNPDEYSFIIANLFSRKDSLSNVLNIVSEKNSPKLILIDKGYRPKEKIPEEIWLEKKTQNESFYDEFDKKNLIIPSYFQVNWEQGGELAASMMHDYFLYCFQERDVKEGEIVILHGNDCFERGFGFRNRIEQLINDSGHLLDHKQIDSDFSSKDSYDKMKSFLLNEKKKDLLGVFCSNDEMALGVRRALTEEYSSADKETVTPKIIGFDGIKDVTIKIDDEGERFLMNTVNVKVNDMTTALVNHIMHYFQTGTWIDEHIESKCEMYIDKATQKRNYAL